MQSRYLLAALTLAFSPLSAPVFGSETPVFSELSLVQSSHHTWFVPVGTRLYASDDGNEWSLAATAPSRIRFLAADSRSLAAAGRDWVLVRSTEKAAEAAALVNIDTDLTALALYGDVWLAADSKGSLWRGEKNSPPTRLTIAEGVKITHLALADDGTCFAAGLKGKGSLLLEAASPTSAWTTVSPENIPVVLQLTSNGRQAVAILADGSVARRQANSIWSFNAAHPFHTGETPTSLLASPQHGYFAVLGDGLSHSWDGLHWFRLSYHDFNDEKRLLALTENGPLFVSVGDDPRTPSLETKPVTLWVDRDRPEPSAIDVLPAESLAPDIAVWDAEISQSADTAGKLSATEKLLQAFSKGSSRLNGHELQAWAKRVVERLAPYLAAEKDRKSLSALMQAHLHLTLEIGKPADEALAPETQEKQEAAPFPPLAPLNSLRLGAGAGNLAAMIDLAISYLQGAGVPADRSAAQFWLDWAHQSHAEIPSLEVLESGDVPLSTLKPLAKLGSIWANVLVADHYREGVDVELDIEAAAQGYRVAAQKGSADALAALGECYLNGWGVEASPEAAVALFVEPAKARNAGALYQMGRCFEMGAGVSMNPGRAAECFLQASQLGDRRAARKVADLLLSGRGVGRDEQKAKAVLSRAAEDGDKEAARRLEALERGAYTPAPPESLASHRKQPAVFPLGARASAAATGDPAAAWDLAQAHAAGLGMYPNPKYAVAWLARARAAGLPEPLAFASDRLSNTQLETLAGLGSAFAPYVLASRLYEAPNADNRNQSLHWFEMAAQRGNPQAQASLGRLLLEEGKPEDEKQGLTLLESAVTNGNPEAMSALASLCATGVHVPLNHTRALTLHRRAAAQGYRPSQVDLAFLIATKQLKGAPPTEAAHWFLTLAGLPEKTVSPETAALMIESQARAGSLQARSVYAVLLKLGFGTPSNPDAATAWSLLADEGHANFYALPWYAEGADMEKAKTYANRLRTQPDAPFEP